MLSSVSIVCLGMCAGMWVISRVFILGCKSRSNAHLVLFSGVL